jgi:hypothetical protein
VESFLCRAKDGNKARKGTHIYTLESYLSVFMCPNKFKISFEEFFEQVKRIYVVGIVFIGSYIYNFNLFLIIIIKYQLTGKLEKPHFRTIIFIKYE